MKRIIEGVLEDLVGSELNFESKTARDTITKLVTSALRSEGTYIKNNEIKISPPRDGSEISIKIDSV